MDWIYIVMGESEPMDAFLTREAAEEYAELQSENLDCYIVPIMLWKCGGKDAYNIDKTVDKLIYNKTLNTEIYPGKWKDICKEAAELRQKLLAEVMK